MRSISHNGTLGYAGVKREFGISDEANVIAFLAIGHMKEPDKKYPGRLPTEKIAFAEKYGGSEANAILRPVNVNL